MKNIIFLSLVLFIFGCSYMQVQRSPALSLDRKQQIEQGIKQPWLYTNANLYCGKQDLIDQKFDLNISSQDLDNPTFPEGTQTLINFANSRFFNEFSCTENGKKILKNNVSWLTQPLYYPTSCEGSFCYQILKYEGMSYLNQSTAFVKSLVEKPRFINIDSQKNQSLFSGTDFDLFNIQLDNSDNKIFDGEIDNDRLVVQVNNIAIEKFPMSNETCLFTVTNKINSKSFDYFITVCNSQVSLIGSNIKMKIIYTHYQDNIDKYVVKLHDQQSISESEINAKLAKFDFNTSNDPVLVELRNELDKSSKEISCPVRATPAQSGLQFKSTPCLKVTDPVPSVFFSVLGLSV